MLIYFKYSGTTDYLRDILCGNAYTVLQVFSYNRLFEGHIICVVMFILYLKYSVTTDYLRDILCVVMLILYSKYSVTTDYLRDILYVW